MVSNTLTAVAGTNTPTAVAPLGNTMPSIYTGATTAITLTPPKGLVAQAAKDKVLLAWEPVIPAAYSSITYQVFRSENEKDLVTPAPLEPWGKPLNTEAVKDEFFLDSAQTCQYPPKPYTLYYYGVIAVDSAGNSSPMSALVKVMNNCELLPPANVEAISEDKKITLSWLRPFSVGEQGLAGYRIFRSLQAGDKGVPLNTSPAAQESWVDEGSPETPLVNGVECYYTIFSQDNQGTLSAPSTQITAMPHVPVSTPLSLTGTGQSDDTIELTWNASNAGTYPVAGYNLYRGSSAGTLDGPINKKLVLDTHYLDSDTNSTSKPLLGKTYVYVVRGVDARNFESRSSATLQATPKAPIEIPQTGLLSTSIPGLPPESSLTISGRKKINIGYTQVIPLDTEPGGNTDRSLATGSTLTKGFNLTQELQVKLQGKVGKKINVDVDYDDRSTAADAQKISILYAGDPDEVLQEAAFGDIMLDLPRTEFAGYNKNLFGAKLKIGLDRFRFTAIGAQTKGITVTETFTGNASTRSVDIPDLSFDTFRYYYLTLDSNQVNYPDVPSYNSSAPIHGLIPGSVTLYVTDTKITANTVRVSQVDAYGNTRTLAFNLQNPGIDYSVDFQRGLISFNTALSYAWTAVAAFKYVDAAGNTRSVGYNAAGTFDFSNPNSLVVPTNGHLDDTHHAIQDFNTTSGVCSYQLLIMNHYSLGYQNIVNPQTDPNFLIKIFKTSGVEVAIPQPSNPIASDPVYLIDPHFGVIQFHNLYPFQGTSTSGDNPTPLTSNNFDATRLDAYSPLHNARIGTSTLNDGNLYRIHIEFKSQITTFQLAHMGVIKDSEVIKKDGSKLRRDTDYMIDYDTGFITFSNPDSISSSTNITITYEYMPFGGKYQSNLFGARAEYDIIPSKFSVGSTYLYNASQAPQDIPDIRSTPTSLSLIDGDAKLSLNPDDFSIIASPLTGKKTKIPISVDATAEGAYSTYQVNTYRYSGENSVAMIDNFEGSDNVVTLPVDNNSWFPASAPVQLQNSDPANRHYVNLDPTNALGRVPLNGTDTKNQLLWSYNNLDANSWDGFVYPVSTSGTNMNGYRYLEISVKSNADATQQVTLHFDLGVVSEDSNGNGRLNFENDGLTLAPGTNIGIANYLHDITNGIRNTLLDPGPVQGIYPSNFRKDYWGSGNGKSTPDTEDLDKNDHLDTAQSYYEYDYTLTPGWNYIKIPLASYSKRLGDPLPTDQTQDSSFLSFVKHVRLWTSGPVSGHASGSLMFESIQLTGNKWQPTVAANFTDPAGNVASTPDANKFNATTISQATDGSYSPNTNFFIYDQSNSAQELRNERALAMEYNLNNQDVVNPGSTTLPAEAAYYLTRLLTTGTGYSYSNYTYLRLDLFKKTFTENGEIFFIRLAIDANNYYQYNFSLDAVPVGTWHTVQAELDGSDQNRLSHFQSGVVPSLNQVTQISMGVLNPNPMGKDEILWVNNLRVTDGKARMGKALRVTTNTKVSDVLTVGTDNRDVDSDFLSIDETPSGKQHNNQATVNAALTKFPFLPVRAGWTRTTIYTEKEHRDDPSYTSNFATPDVTNEVVNGEVGYTQIPGMDLSFKTSQTRKVTEYINQSYNINNQERTTVLNPGLSYTLPRSLGSFPIGSSTFTGNLTVTNDQTNYDNDFINALNSTTTNTITGVSTGGLTNTTFAQRTDLYNRWTDSRLERYAYNGSYQPLDYVSITPNFSYNQTSQRGFLSLYRFYSGLDPVYSPDNPKYFSDAYRVSQYDRTAKLDINLLHIPALTPTFSYSMSHARDYVNDTYSIPNATLGVRTGFSPGDLVGWTQFPKFNLGRNYTESATFQHNPDETNDPISGLDNKTLWWINPATFENSDPTFDAAFINSKSYTDNINTALYLGPDVSLSPQYTNTWSRKMNLSNFNTSKTLSLGSTLVWSRVPLLQKLINLQSFNLDFQYKKNQNFDTNNLETSRDTGYTANLTLPFRFSSDLSGSLTGGYATDMNQNGQDLNVIIYQNRYTEGGSIAYNLHMLEPIRLPDFWPFMGAQLKLEQALRIVDSLNIESVRNTEVNITGQELNTDTITNDTTFDYSLWKNVLGNVKLTNQWYYNRTLADKDYYALSFSLGLTATF
jgi:hypothetical protein